MNGNEWAEIGQGMIPIYGTYKEAQKLYENPSWSQLGWTAASAVTDVLPFLKWAKLAGKAGQAVVKTVQASSAAAREAREARAIATALRGTPAAQRALTTTAGRELSRATAEQTRDRAVAELKTILTPTVKSTVKNKSIDLGLNYEQQRQSK